MRQKAGGLLSRCFRSRAMSLAVVVCVVLLFALSFLSDTLEATELYQRKQTYGYHNGAVFQSSAATRELLARHLSVTGYGTMEICRQILGETDGGIGAVGVLGVVDEDFQAMENLSFLEGSYPTAEGEIAMEASLLTQLHLTYELGQEITLTLAEETAGGALIQSAATYTLCGILNTYSTHWLSGEQALCSAIVAEFPDKPVRTHFFFRSDYEKEEEMEELAVLLTGPGEELVYNSYTYPDISTQAGAALILRSLSVGGAVLCLLFLIGVQASQRKGDRYRIRVVKLLGGSRGTLYRCIFAGGVFQWMKAYAFAAAGCTALALLVRQLAALTGSQFRCSWGWQAYAVSGGLSLGVILLGALTQAISLQATPILPPGRDLTRLESKGAPGRTPGRSLDQAAFLKIERRRLRRYAWVEKGCVALPTVLIVACLLGAIYDYRAYQIVSRIVDYDYSWEASQDSGMGLTLQQIRQIRNTENIEEVCYTRKAFSAGVMENESGTATVPICLYYDGVWEDPYAACMNMGGNEELLRGMSVTIVTLPEDSGFFEYYLPKGLDKDSFLTGEVCIVYLPEIIERADGYLTVNTYSVNQTPYVGESCFSTVEVGQALTLTAGGPSVETSCGAILRTFPGATQEGKDFLQAGTVLVSESLYQKLFPTENEIYNYVLAYGSSRLSYDVSDKKMSQLTTEGAITFTNNRLERQQERQAFLERLLLQGGITLAAAVLSLVILCQSRAGMLNREAQRQRLLAGLGADARILERVYRTVGKKAAAVWLAAVNLAALAGWVFHFWSSVWVLGGQNWERVFYVTQYAFVYFPWPVYLGVQALFVLAVFLIFMSVASTAKRFIQ